MSPSTLIVEDHPLYRGALLQLMASIGDGAGTLAAASAQEGLRLAELLPDLRLLLLDFHLPGMAGTEAVTSFRRKCPAAAIVVVSASEDRRDAAAALRAGARAFVSKAVSSEVLAELAQGLLVGVPCRPEWITPAGRVTMDAAAAPRLTPRQQEILELLSQGCANREIAERLGLAQVTVKVHLSAVFRALGVVNRTQAVLAGRRLGLTE